MDIIQPFSLEDTQFKGAFIAADATLDAVCAGHAYPPWVRAFLGEAVALALALSAGIKYDGVFALQIKGDGPLSFALVETTSEKQVRAAVSYAPQKKPRGTDLAAVVGAGELIFSVSRKGASPYQGVITLRSDSLRATALDYFRHSEQLATALVLQTRGAYSRCLILQQLPPRAGQSADSRADAWETACVLLSSVTADELFSPVLAAKDVLFRLFHSSDLRLFEPGVPSFSCRCSRAQMRSFLKTLPPAELEACFRNDALETACHFCGSRFVFTRKDF